MRCLRCSRGGEFYLADIGDFSIAADIWTILGNLSAFVTVGTFAIFVINRIVYRPKFEVKGNAPTDTGYDAVIRHVDGLLMLPYFNYSGYPVRVDMVSALIFPDVLAVYQHDSMSRTAEFGSGLELGVHTGPNEPWVGVIDKPNRLFAHKSGTTILIGADWCAGDIKTEAQLYIRAVVDDSALPFPFNMFPPMVTTTKYRLLLRRHIQE